ncbi:MAG: hypothetical protein KDD66_16165 [Bdellovibrionales bacterium]|nr:hypothetical protein [Bdellovibrionales bacterium]
MIEIAASAGLFILLWIVLGNTLFKPYIRLIEEREARTMGDEKRAGEAARETERISNEIKEELRQAALHGIKIRDSHVAEAKAEANQVTEHASNVAAKELTAARKEIAKLVAEARDQINQDAQQVAGAMLDRLLTGSGSQPLH